MTCFSSPRGHGDVSRGRGVWVGGTLCRMDAAVEPYLFEIWQRRCREPAWAAVRAWI